MRGGQSGVGMHVTDGFVTMAYAMLVGIGLVYLLLMLLVTFFALLLTIIGAFVAFAVIGHAPDLSAIIGLLMLRGIVVTNAIVLLDPAVVTHAILARGRAGRRRLRGEGAHQSG